MQEVHMQINWDVEIQKFIDYCSRYDPSFISQLAGATDSELAQLEMLAGLPLPREYRAFLTHFGNTPSNSFGDFLSETEFNIEAATNFYSDPYSLRAPKMTFLWTVDFDYTLFLGTQPERPEGQPVLHVTWTMEDEVDSIVEMHDSLIELLYGMAFRYIRFKGLQHFAEFTGTRGAWDNKEHGDRKASYLNIAERLGFTTLPFMNKQWVCSERGDAAISYSTRKGFSDPVIQLAAADKMEFDRLSEILCDNLYMWRRQ